MKRLKFAMSQPIFMTSQNLWSSALHLCFGLPFVRNSCTCQQLVALVDGQLLLSNKLDWRETFSVELFRFFPSLAGIFSFRKSDRSFIEALSNAGLVLLGAHLVKFSHNDHLRVSLVAHLELLKPNLTDWWARARLMGNKYKSVSS